MTALFSFWAAHAAELALLTRQHLVLVLVSTLAAVAVGVPAGILAARRPILGRTVLLAANVLQTVPSLALLGFLLPLPFIGGLGPRTALVTLSIYALLPVIRMTVTGIRSVDPAVVEAGIAMGMTDGQLLRLVQLPLALPSIVAGIRVATVIGVGTATIAAAVGAGGLGEYIFRGLSMVDTTTILAGAVPAAGLALVADGLLALLEQRLRGAPPTSRAAGGVALGLAAALAAGAAVSLLARPTADVVVVGSKNFTEQIILGELVAQAIEAEGNVRVERKLNLGGTFVADRGLRSGELDVYVEYTGTAVTAVFHEAVPHDPAQAFERARTRYAEHGLTVRPSLGFNNTFAILVRSDDAQALGLRTVDDLRRVSGRFTPGFGYEFLQRDDGYAGLTKAYDLAFTHPARGMDLSLIYQALAERQVDVIAGDATSALIDAFHLTALEDTRHYFPPYDAVPVVRAATLLRHPEVGRALDRLAGHLPDSQMRALNAAVDVRHEDVAAVARTFLSTLARSR